MDVRQQKLAARLAQRQLEQLYRRRHTLNSAQGPHVDVDGQSLINFSSNDYLGLAAQAELVKAMQEACQQYGVGSGASHLVCGHSIEHHLLEQELAEFLGCERAVLFSTGYMANLGVLTALLGRGDAVFQDKLNHASLLDGALLSRAKLQRFQHNNIQSLQRAIERSSAENKLIAVDSVFSMDGDIAPLDALAQLAEQHNAWLMADDAHGFGVIGEQGRGCRQFFGLNQQSLPIVMGTLGKALGGFGAFVAGSEVLIETLIQFARSYIYTTALPPAVAAANRAGLALLQQQSWRQETLQSHIHYFCQQASELGLPLMPSSTAIQPLLVGDAETALLASQQLKQQGFWVVAIRPPTVPHNESRLRITLTAAHTREDIDALLSALADLPALQGCSDEHKS